MVKEYFLVYLFYGFFMVNLGIFCLKAENSEGDGLSLLPSLRYLGWFGILHGLSEWAALVGIAGLYPGQDAHLYNITQLLKGLSFAVLFLFGVDLIDWPRPFFRRLVLAIPGFLYLFFLSGYLQLIYSRGPDHHILAPGFHIIAMRYGLGLTGGLAAAAGMLAQARAREKHRSPAIAGHYRQLAGVFFIYGLLEGLFVTRQDFFPASVLNREAFFRILGMETLFFKALTGLAVNYLISRVLDIHRSGRNERFRRLEDRRIAAEERSLLRLEVHDSIIQSLYAAGLDLELALRDKSQDSRAARLLKLKAHLNTTIGQTRDLMTSTALDVVAADELDHKITALIRSCRDQCDLTFDYRFEISPLMAGDLTPEYSTQIYYILQEALSNIMKHSGARTASVTLTAEQDRVDILVRDDGIGMSRTTPREGHFGIESMRSRTEGLGGTFRISSPREGVLIEITGIPWEGQ